MHSTQLLENRSADTDAALEARDNRHSVVARARQALSDCHSAEHLLLGTHNLDGESASLPVCLTCRFQRRAA